MKLVGCLNLNLVDTQEATSGMRAPCRCLAVTVGVQIWRLCESPGRQGSQPEALLMAPPPKSCYMSFRSDMGVSENRDPDIVP